MNKWCFLFFCLILAFTATSQSHIYTFKECLDMALDKNVQIAQSGITVEANKWTLYRSKGNMIPNLNFNGSQNFTFGRSVDPYTNQYITQNIRSNNFSLTSSLVLFNGLQVRNTIRQNDLLLNASALDLQKAKNDLSLNVAGAYLQVLLDLEQIDNLKLQIQTDSQQLDRTDRLLKGGKLTENDLLLSKSQLASDNLTLAQTEGSLALAKLTLMQYMEIPETDSFEIEKLKLDKPNIKDFGNPAQIYQVAQQLPEVQSAKIKTQSSLMGYKIARGGLYPKLSLNGSLSSGYSSSNKLYDTQVSNVIEPIGYLQNDPSSIVLSSIKQTTSTPKTYTFGGQLRDNFSQQISLTLAVPIFNNRQVKNNMEQAKLNIQNSKLNEDLTNLTLRKNIEQAFTDVKSIEKQYAASVEQLNAVLSTYNNLKTKYNVGVASAIDLSIEKNSYLQAVSTEIQARYTYFFKALILDFYLGKPLAINAPQ